MQGIYKLPKGWAIFMGIAGVLFIGLGIGLMLIPYYSESKGEDIWIAYLLLFSIFTLPISALGIVSLFEVFYAKFVIEEDRVYSKGLFNNYSFSFDEITGFNKTQNYVSVFSGKKRMRISKYLKDIDKIHAWLDTKFPNLDTIRQEEEKAEVMKNADVLLSPSYQQKLKTAKYVTYSYNALAIGNSMWLAFYPKPYNFAVLAGIIVVLIGILIPKFSSGLIAYTDSKSDKRPTTAIGFTLPCLIVGLRAMLDVNIFDYSPIWTPSLVLATLLTLVISIGKDFIVKKVSSYFRALFLWVLFFGYSFGAITLTNTIYDDTPAKKYKAQIIDKRISSGDVTTYHFELNKWHETAPADDIQVSEDMYYELEKNDSIDIYLKEGKFGIPWLIPN
ncbi:hypothetical protein [Bernardetia sp. MNP-M8]|uniref:hypothetical protein n=1 Tax=Bernardetia sp. MNP-M8 TaxID=3127470 RepID=UPI0030D4315F